MSDSLGESAGSSTRTYSFVWSHFKLVENEEKTQCNYCGMLYKKTGGNTTNLYKHLQKKHPSKVKTEVESGKMDKFVKKELPNVPGELSFTLDAWTSPSYIPFLGITVHWISYEWELKEILINFCKLSGPHSGENLHKVFVKCCDDMRILTKVLSTF
ncbi:zinc finger BED domain-containing protein RICESLEEPER 2-like [Rhizophagus clarus]|uniref:Zinc finger BED domain-containing protein RICESLEEPER 2-like n=1 Tax=Rhizophagus clarus TaxID=94130 RepID=A0A8H3QRN2_9GLOM|nr:zinc finger BED domain-containing protein RICESLEEPER 2-like [Rhizophagus clarus]